MAASSTAAQLTVTAPAGTPGLQVRLASLGATTTNVQIQRRITPGAVGQAITYGVPEREARSIYLLTAAHPTPTDPTYWTDFTCRSAVDYQYRFRQGDGTGAWGAWSHPWAEGGWESYLGEGSTGWPTETNGGLTATTSPEALTPHVQLNHSFEHDGAVRYGGWRRKGPGWLSAGNELVAVVVSTVNHTVAVAVRAGAPTGLSDLVLSHTTPSGDWETDLALASIPNVASTSYGSNVAGDRNLGWAATATWRVGTVPATGTHRADLAELVGALLGNTALELGLAVRAELTGGSASTYGTVRQPGTASTGIPSDQSTYSGWAQQNGHGYQVPDHVPHAIIMHSTGTPAAGGIAAARAKLLSPVAGHSYHLLVDRTGAAEWFLNPYRHRAWHAYDAARFDPATNDIIGDGNDCLGAAFCARPTEWASMSAAHKTALYDAAAAALKPIIEATPITVASGSYASYATQHHQYVFAHAAIANRRLTSGTTGGPYAADPGTGFSMTAFLLRLQAA